MKDSVFLIPRAMRLTQLGEVGIAFIPSAKLPFEVEQLEKICAYCYFACEAAFPCD
jgi:hypothetical protein